MSFEINRNYNTGRMEKPKKPLEDMTNEEKRILFSVNLAHMLAKRAELEVPQNNTFAPLILRMDIPGTQNEVKYVLSYDEIEPKNSRRFSMHANRNGSDRDFQVYLSKGTKQEIINFLNNRENEDLLINSLQNLSDSIDEFYS